MPLFIDVNDSLCRKILENQQQQKKKTLLELLSNYSMYEGYTVNIQKFTGSWSSLCGKMVNESD